MSKSPRSVSILGSTGSIGKSSVNLLELHRDKFTVEALTAYNNVDELAIQARKLRCQWAVIGNETLYQNLKSALSGTGIEAAAGTEATIEAAMMPSDTVIAAI